MTKILQPVLETSNLVAITTKLMMRFVQFGVRGAEVRAGDSSSGSDSELEGDELNSLSSTWSPMAAQQLAVTQKAKAARRARVKASYLSETSSMADSTVSILPTTVVKKVRKVDREPKWDTHRDIALVFQGYLNTLVFLSDRSPTGGQCLLSPLSCLLRCLIRAVALPGCVFLTVILVSSFCFLVSLVCFDALIYRAPRRLHCICACTSNAGSV